MGNTRWNSTFKQLQYIAALDQVKMNTLLRERGHENLIRYGWTDGHTNDMQSHNHALH